MKDFVKCENGRYINLNQAHNLMVVALYQCFQVRAEIGEDYYCIKEFLNLEDAERWLANLMLQRTINA